MCSFAKPVAPHRFTDALRKQLSSSHSRQESNAVFVGTPVGLDSVEIDRSCQPPVSAARTALFTPSAMPSSIPRQLNRSDTVIDSSIARPDDGIAVLSPQVVASPVFPAAPPPSSQDAAVNALMQGFQQDIQKQSQQLSELNDRFRMLETLCENLRTRLLQVRVSTHANLTTLRRIERSVATVDTIGILPVLYSIFLFLVVDLIAPTTCQHLISQALRWLPARHQALHNFIEAYGASALVVIRTSIVMVAVIFVIVGWLAWPLAFVGAVSFLVAVCCSVCQLIAALMFVKRFDNFQKQDYSDFLHASGSAERHARAALVEAIAPSSSSDGSTSHHDDVSTTSAPDVKQSMILSTPSTTMRRRRHRLSQKK